jgi:hypothetical protein
VDLKDTQTVCLVRQKADPINFKFKYDETSNVFTITPPDATTVKIADITNLKIFGKDDTVVCTYPE